MGFQNDKLVKARKDYWCTLCGEKILAGEKYIYSVIGVDKTLKARRFHIGCSIVDEVEEEYWRGAE